MPAANEIPHGQSTIHSNQDAVSSGECSCSSSEYCSTNPVVPTDMKFVICTAAIVFLFFKVFAFIENVVSSPCSFLVLLLVMDKYFAKWYDLDLSLAFKQSVKNHIPSLNTVIEQITEFFKTIDPSTTNTVPELQSYSTTQETSEALSRYRCDVLHTMSIKAIQNYEDQGRSTFSVLESFLRDNRFKFDNSPTVDFSESTIMGISFKASCGYGC